MTETGRKINYSNMGAMLAVSLCGIVVGLLNSVDVMRGFNIPAFSFQQIPIDNLLFAAVVCIVVVMAIVVSITMMFRMVGGMGRR